MTMATKVGRPKLVVIRDHTVTVRLSAKNIADLRNIQRSIRRL